MELKTLFIGIVFAMGIFAIKNGVGLHYLLTYKNRKIFKILMIALYLLIYFIAFILISYVLQIIDIIYYFEIIQKWLHSAMFIHVIMASGLMIWGIYLLKRNNNQRYKSSYGWIALLIPCPICITVIFISLSFIISYFPNAGYLASISVYLVFMTIVSLTVAGMEIWNKGISFSENSEATMGAAMMLISAYFFLSVVIMPQFSNIDKIYRLAAYHPEVINTPVSYLLSLIIAVTFFFFSGFFLITKKYKRAH